MSTTPTSSGTSPTPPTSPDLFDQVRAAAVARWHRRRGASTTRFAWTKATAFVATILMWTYGFYYGWVAMPDLAALGGAIGIIALVAVIVGPFILVRAERMLLRYTGLALLGVGVWVLTSQGANLSVLFADFTIASTLGLVLAVLWTAGVMIWLCRTSRPRRPRPAPQGGVATLTPPTPPTP